MTMTVVSYRLYCEECPNKQVLREDRIEDSNWRLINLHYHEAICPTCNDNVDLDEDDEFDEDMQEVSFEDLDSIGDAGATNLREKGIVTRGDVKDASDEEILDTSWVGEKGLKSIRNAVR